jgi:hypothetical protein
MLAWRYGNEDPYRLYNMLDGRYVPWGGGESRPPAHPSRLRAFVYACAEVAFEEDAKLSGAKVSSRRQ